MKLYKYKKYKENFPKMFLKEKLKILKLLPYAKIEHIGSTSIIGLGGKGVIDILIGVNEKNIKKSRKELIKNKYRYKNSMDNRHFFIIKKGFFIKKRYHLHLTVYNNNIWKKAIKFRNYLRKNNKAKNDYILLKKHAYILCKEDSDCYHKFKENYIKNILKKNV